jgi:integrase
MFDALEEKKLSVLASRWREPLLIETIKLIRRAIGPNRDGVFPPNVFAEKTRYRNWIMFEMVLNLGPRKGEVLTLKVEHLSKGRTPGEIYVPRQQDASEDPRTRRRPRGKTTERRVPLMDLNLLPFILKYRDEEPPVGRNDPRHKSPYLFLTEAGQPVSNSTADYIIKQIKRYTQRLIDSDQTIDEGARERCKEDLQDLSWHRLRHTWAVNAARGLYPKHGEGTWAILRQWGGWRNTKSMERYVECFKREISDAALVSHLSKRPLKSEDNDNAAT